MKKKATGTDVLAGMLCAVLFFALMFIAEGDPSLWDAWKKDRNNYIHQIFNE